MASLPSQQNHMEGLSPSQTHTHSQTHTYACPHPFFWTALPLLALFNIVMLLRQWLVVHFWQGPGVLSLLGMLLGMLVGKQICCSRLPFYWFIFNGIPCACHSSAGPAVGSYQVLLIWCPLARSLLAHLLNMETEAGGGGVRRANAWQRPRRTPATSRL